MCNKERECVCDRERESVCVFLLEREGERDKERERDQEESRVGNKTCLSMQFRISLWRWEGMAKAVHSFLFQHCKNVV